LINRTQL